MDTIAGAIDTIALRAHARFLSHDSLGGRANGSHGQRIAADYIIGHLRRLGLEPMGANGDYRQAVPLTRVTLPREDARLILGGKSRALVVDGDQHLAVFSHGFHEDGGSRRGMLDRIVEADDDQFVL